MKRGKSTLPAEITNNIVEGSEHKGSFVLRHGMVLDWKLLRELMDLWGRDFYLLAEDAHIKVEYDIVPPESVEVLYESKQEMVPGVLLKSVAVLVAPKHQDKWMSLLVHVAKSLDLVQFPCCVEVPLGMMAKAVVGEKMWAVEVERLMEDSRVAECLVCAQSDGLCVLIEIT
jgi:hypothetical protein